MVRAKASNPQPTSSHKQHLYFNFLRLQRIYFLFMVKFDFRLANKKKQQQQQNFRKKKNLRRKKLIHSAREKEYHLSTIQNLRFYAIVVVCIESRCFTFIIVQHPLAFHTPKCKHFYQISFGSIAMKTFTEGERSVLQVNKNAWKMAIIFDTTSHEIKCFCKIYYAWKVRGWIFPSIQCHLMLTPLTIWGVLIHWSAVVTKFISSIDVAKAEYNGNRKKNDNESISKKIV